MVTILLKSYQLNIESLSCQIFFSWYQQISAKLQPNFSRSTEYFLSLVWWAEYLQTYTARLHPGLHLSPGASTGDDKFFTLLFAILTTPKRCGRLGINEPRKMFRLTQGKCASHIRGEQPRPCLIGLRQNHDLGFGDSAQIPVFQGFGIDQDPIFGIVQMVHQ